MLSNDDGSLLQICINFIRKDCDTIAPAISEPPMVHVCPQPAHCPPLQHCTAHLAGPWGACRARNWICPLDDIKELTVKTEMESLAGCYLGSGPTQRIWWLCHSVPANQQAAASNKTLHPVSRFLFPLDTSSFVYLLINLKDFGRRTLAFCISVCIFISFCIYRTQVSLGSDLWVRLSLTE